MNHFFLLFLLSLWRRHDDTSGLISSSSVAVFKSDAGREQQESGHCCCSWLSDMAYVTSRRSNCTQSACVHCQTQDIGPFHATFWKLSYKLMCAKPWTESREIREAFSLLTITFNKLAFSCGNRLFAKFPPSHVTAHLRLRPGFESD